MIKVERRDNKLVVVIPDEYELPYWADKMYHKDIITNDKVETIIPCRECTVSISKPTIVRTPMGNAQQMNSYNEIWTYFDIPMKSILVNEGDDLTEELQLKLKEVPVIEETKEEVKD